MSPADKSAGSRKWLEDLRRLTADKERRDQIAQLVRSRKLLKFDPEYKKKKIA